MLPPLHACTVAVIGLGYVGLPLAVELARPQSCRRSGVRLNHRVIGFDIDGRRLDALRQGIDHTHEVSTEQLRAAVLLEFSSDPHRLAEADVFVITVPTPIDAAHKPDLAALEQAMATVGRAIRNRNRLQPHCLPVVILESTVYPGATEEVCQPILERHAGLAANQGFLLGYSPERINPGDQEHRLTTVVKVTSGATPEAAAWVDGFYGSIVEAGTHLAPSIQVAETAKVIENTQRDLNIALANELAVICSRIGIDTLDVLQAAGTKWNFLPFRPGLVGGHCIGVDPYYLTYKAEQLGYHPEVVLAGRRINDGMGRWLVQQLVLALVQGGQTIRGAQVLVLGLSFKENCPDLRNTGVAPLLEELKLYGMEPTVVDPWVDPAEAQAHYALSVHPQPPAGRRFAAVIAAVAHRQFQAWPLQRWRELLAEGGVLLDVKGMVPRELGAMRL